MPAKKQSKVAALSEEIEGLRREIAKLRKTRRDSGTKPRKPGRRKRSASAARPQKSANHKRPGKERVPLAVEQQTPHPAETAIPLYELQEVRTARRSASALSPRHFEQSEGGPLGDLLEHARLYWLAGDWTSLASLDVHHLSRHPERARICALIASALSQQRKNDQARGLLQLARTWGCGGEFLSMTLAAGAARNLAQAHLLAGREKKAGEALAAGFGNAGLTNKLASLLLSGAAGAPDTATQSSSTAPAGSPGGMLHALLSPRSPRPAPVSRDNQARTLNNNGEHLYHAGQYQLAAEYFQRALNLQPRDAWICQNLAEAVARLDPARARQWECANLGRAISAAGKWEVAVRYYRMALQLSRHTVEAHRQAQRFKIEPPQAAHAPNPVFIVGCGHSATSLMLAMLGSHPQIYPVPKETAMFLRTDEKMQEAMHEFDEATAQAGKNRWVEKTPPHIFQIHRFLALRPASRFVVMLRDGRDVVCSMRHRQKHFAVRDRVERWIYDNMAADAYREHPQVTFLKYEDLVTDAENTLRRLCDFLGVAFTESLLRFHETPRRWYSDYIAKPAAITSHQEHLANRNWQLNQPLFDGRGRWHQDMSSEEREYFKASPAQDLLVQLGYADDAAW